jgi:hypothetical protein
MVVAYMNLSRASPVNAPFSNRIFMNFSVHFIGVNAVLLLLGWAPFHWTVVIAAMAFYHSLSYLVRNYFPTIAETPVTAKLTSLLHSLEEGSRMELVTSTFEIMGVVFRPPMLRMIGRLLFAAFYCFWYLLFRYQSSPAHRLVWQGYATKYRELVGYLPTFIGNFLLSIPESLGKLGTLAFEIYKVRTIPVG